MSDLAPIVLFVYNRPEHTARTLSALASSALAGDSDLVVYADGPKKQEHLQSIASVRDVVRSATSSFKSTRIIERDQNMGLANSIISGVSEVCSERGRAIVLEDDLVVAPEFLSFMNAGLDRYDGQQEVFQISGYMFPIARRPQSGAMFLPLISCWGWGTWSRAWSQFEPSAPGYERLKADPILRARFNLDGSYDYYTMLNDQMEGRIDSWGVRWLLSVFLKNGLVLYPERSLVQNIGVDGSGTHGVGAANLQERVYTGPGSATRDFLMPSDISIDMDALGGIKQMLRDSQPHPFVRLIRKILR